MNDNFTPANEELERVADELNRLRRDLQSTLSTIERIEKRLKATFAAYAPVKGPGRVARLQKNSLSTKDETALLADFDALILATRERGDAGFEQHLSIIAESDILALAYELGVTGKSLVKAKSGIRKRVQESILLAYNPKAESRRQENEVADRQV